MPPFCGHCGRKQLAPSPDDDCDNRDDDRIRPLLRCSRCKSAWYCGRACQSLAWTDGHRRECRRLRRALVRDGIGFNDIPSSSATTTKVEGGRIDGEGARDVGVRKAGCAEDDDARRTAEDAIAAAALSELKLLATATNPAEAHRIMHLARDEVRRLSSASTATANPQQEEGGRGRAEDSSSSAVEANRRRGRASPPAGRGREAAAGSEKKEGDKRQRRGRRLGRSNGAGDKKTEDRDRDRSSRVINRDGDAVVVLGGWWFEDEGLQRRGRDDEAYRGSDRRCSVEMLPNIRAYSIALTSAHNPSPSLWREEGLRLSLSARSAAAADGEDGGVGVPEEASPPSLLPPEFTEAHLWAKGRRRRRIGGGIGESVVEVSLPSSREEMAEDLIFSAVLPGRTAAINGSNARAVTVDERDGSVSIRIRLPDGVYPEALSSLTTTATATKISDLDYLRCRACGHALLRPGAVRSVLPLPSGQWDDISDLVMCYEGPDAVDFSARFSTASGEIAAVRGASLEDGTSLVLHGRDASAGPEGNGSAGVGVGGVCVLGGVVRGGYRGFDGDDRGDRLRAEEEDRRREKSLFPVSAAAEEVNEDDGGELAAVGVATAACANCCSVLGSAPDRGGRRRTDEDGDCSFRLYKHLLGCGRPRRRRPRRIASPGAEDEDDGIGDDGNVDDDEDDSAADVDAGTVESGGAAGMFSEHTVATFVAREMVRRAESDGTYSFAVSVAGGGRGSDDRRCVFLRMLSWDTTMATATAGDFGDHDYASRCESGLSLVASKGVEKKEQEGEEKDDYPRQRAAKFRKVLKVVFEEAVIDDDRAASPYSDTFAASWTQGGILDPCCFPAAFSGHRFGRSADDGDGANDNDDENVEEDSSRRGKAKAAPSPASGASSMLLPEREWHELRNGLVSSSQFFPESVRAATVALALGRAAPTDGGGNNALLSFLPLPPGCL